LGGSAESGIADSDPRVLEGGWIAVNIEWIGNFLRGKREGELDLSARAEGTD
jgi:hypothetical protein